MLFLPSHCPPKALGEVLQASAASGPMRSSFFKALAAVDSYTALSWDPASRHKTFMPKKKREVIFFFPNELFSFEEKEFNTYFLSCGKYSDGTTETWSLVMRSRHKVPLRKMNF